MIKINCDVGEGVGNEKLLFNYITSCSIACGGHAGDANSMREILSLAKAFKVSAGAHPSYPDKTNFGRVSIDISKNDLIRSIREQIDQLIDISSEFDISLDHIKAHGALYNDCAKHPELAQTFLTAIGTYQLPIYAPYGSVIAEITKEHEVDVIYEGFADRMYNSDLSLVSRSSKNAIINNPKSVEDHVRLITGGFVKSKTGEKIPIKVETYCIHSDTDNAVEIAKHLFAYFNLVFKPYGDKGVLIEWPQKMTPYQLDDLLNLKEHLHQEVLQGVSSLLVLDEHDVSKLREIYLSLPAQSKRSFYLHTIPVCYDLTFGEDLNQMSTSLGLSVEEIINLHSNGLYTVYSLGFLPGFAYLGGLDKRLHITRKAEPRLKIPKGAVGIGGEQTGIYPQESPGGWQLIGRTPIEMFNPLAKEPCLLNPGDKIKFEKITKTEFNEILSKLKSGNYQLRKEVIHD